MRIREPKTTALIFASGKMVVTGAKSEDDSKLASRKYARIIQKLGFAAKFTDFKIQNIVGSCDIKFPIRLEGLASKHHPFSSYEPELFPGLIYRMIKPKIVLLIFVSGKIVLTGAKVREEIYQAFETIYPTLQGIFLPIFGCRVHANNHRFQKNLRIRQAVLYHYRLHPIHLCWSDYRAHVHDWAPRIFSIAIISCKNSKIVYDITSIAWRLGFQGNYIFRLVVTIGAMVKRAARFSYQAQIDTNGRGELFYVVFDDRLSVVHSMLLLQQL